MTPDMNDRAEETRLAATAGGALAALGMILLMMAGLLLNMQQLLSAEARAGAAPHSLTQMLDGTASRDIAAELAQTTLAENAARLQRAANWLILNDLGPKVREGCTGWLFLAEELSVHPGAAMASAARIERVIAVQKALARRNIDLFIAVVPDKSRVMATRLCALERPSILNSRAAHWVETLQQHGVAAIDLTTALETTPVAAFLRNDTHWSQAGARQAAHALAQRINALRNAPLEPRQKRSFSAGAALPWDGDLVRLAGIDWLPYRIQPAGEDVPPLQFEVLSTGPADNALSEDDLFGDANLPTVALIGTSFSRTSYFADFLSMALETPVANLAKDGGAFSGAAHAYFQSAAFRQTPPELLIWEIPERDLETPLNNDKAFSIDMADSSQ